MKVGLIGNMNNNNFAIMRYLHDLGVEAHLLLWKNDGVGSLAHFSVENDSWCIDSWSKYIHQTGWINGYASVLFTSKSEIKRTLQPYDHLIGSGVAPALCNKADRPLDIFYPYASGIEFVATGVDLQLFESGPLPRRLVYKLLKRKQIEGIRKAKTCINPDIGHTKETLDSIQKKYVAMQVPMVYNKIQTPENEQEKLRSRFPFLKDTPFKVISHARHMWKDPLGYTESEWKRATKRNDWVIKGFADFLQRTDAHDSKLILLDYGPDVPESKKLIQSLDLEPYVTWLPILPRKELMYILSQADVGVGEFLIYPRAIWGGTTWECLAAGLPALQSFNFSDKEYGELYNHPQPPLLDVKKVGDVTDHLLMLHENSNKRVEIGKSSRDWFNAHNGIGLAKKWLNLLGNQ